MKRLKYIVILVLFLVNYQIIFSQETIKKQESEITNDIKGTVLDYDSSPLIEAKIKIKSLDLITSTNSEGNFILKDIKIFPVTIEVTKSGYQDTEVVLESYQPFVIIKLNVIERHLEAVVVASRRKNEEVQKIPIPIAVLGGKKVEESGSFNVNRVKELVPSVQLYSSNPRNTTLNIRGLGSTFGLTNDGIEPGVGFYVDGVYYARPAATALDFIDLDRIEVLRGPQGTLFGKNTTAGTFNIFTKKPTFSTTNTVEVSYGNYGYIQAKTSLNGKLFDKIAGRISFSGTQRDGVIENVRTEQKINDLNNLGFRSQLLYKPTDNLEIILAGDYNRQRPDGYAQVIAGVVKTQRAAYRQFDQIINDLGYALPSLNAFDRKVDNDVSWRSNNDLGGISLNIDSKLGNGKVTSTTAWRFWDWDPSNDRDFTGLSALKRSQAPSYHSQFSQEIRYSGDLIKDKLSVVSGIFGIHQKLETKPFHYEESGKDQWRFSQSTTSSLWQTPGLFEGYGIKTYYNLKNKSLAWFNQLDWAVISKFHLLVGLRYNYDEKAAIYDRTTYGGLQTSDPALLALKRLVYTDQAFDVSVSDRNISGQLTANYSVNDAFIIYGTYSKSYKPVGVNIGGLPTDSGRVMIELATVKPESVDHFELGLKSSFTKAQFNVTLFNTTIKDYQTLVQSPELGVNRGYLSNAEKVQVQGFEIEASLKATEYLSFTSSVSYTDGKYIKFTNAPLPLEETGASVSFKDISGGRLPGISKWSGSVGADVSKKSKILGFNGAIVAGINTYFRSEFSSSPTPSQYLNIDGYALFNARIGFKTVNGTTISIWGRNVFDKNYFEQLLPAAGNAGNYAGVLGDPATFGLTVKFAIK